uniref:Galectin n=1 Tax=Rhabditophanes sp. KR3021 TaxID=114890 RepID=A0AC35TYQ1_9BILA
MHTINDPIVPFALPICETLLPGSRIAIHGKCHFHHGHSQDFAIELLSESDILLIADFRFKHGPHKEHNLIVNSCIDKVWGTEIKQANPIHHNDNFVVTVEVHDRHYSVAINGFTVASLNHRAPYQNVRAVGVKGQANIEKIHFEGFSNYDSWSGNHTTHNTHYIGYGTETFNPSAFKQNRSNDHFCTDNDYGI